MTKSTLSTLWLAGGGLLATWVAVSPNTGPIASNRGNASRNGAAREVTLDDLRLREADLRDHAGNMPLRPSTRNPFRFGKAVAVHTARPSVAAPAVVTSLPPPRQPLLHLSGIATDGQKRTAIISTDSQLYLVKIGEPVAERYHVVSIDSDAVTLHDDDGTDIRLVLH